MPVSVVVAVAVQLSLAAAFVVMLCTYHVVSPRAQSAVDDEARRQGVPPEALAEHGISLTESAGEAAIGYGIAAVLAGLAGLTIVGSGLGQLLSWIIQPIILLGVGYVTTIQVFAIPFTEAAIRRSNDTRVQGMDVRKALGAAVAELPSWYRPLTVLRWLLTTAGSVLVVVLLATPAANAFFD